MKRNPKAVVNFNILAAFTTALIACFQCHAIKNQNQNRFVGKVQNLESERESVPSFMSLQFYPSNMTGGDQQKHLTHAFCYQSVNSSLD